MIKLSILIPVYNVSKYFRHCLNSVYSQINDFCEVILVDDGSSDGSGLICDEYKKQYSIQTRVFHKQNEGAYSTRNFAFQKSSGEYVWFIDPDDYIQNDAINNIFKLIDGNNHIDVISLAFKRNDGKESGNLENSYPLETISGEEYLIRGKIDPYLWSKVYRSDFLRENNLSFNNKLYTQGDWLFNMYVFTSNKVSILLTDIYAYNYYNANPTSTLHAKSMKNRNRGVNNSMIANEEFITLMDKFKNARIYGALENWNNYNLSGFFYSLLFIDYPIKEIKKIINDYKTLHLYPLGLTNNNRKANLFILFVNRSVLFVLFCRIIHFIKYQL
jgi:glycosyltransferase involved in cell wall biosynthesis